MERVLTIDVDKLPDRIEVRGKSEGRLFPPRVYVTLPSGRDPTGYASAGARVEISTVGETDPAEASVETAPGKVVLSKDGCVQWCPVCGPEEKPMLVHLRRDRNGDSRIEQVLCDRCGWTNAPPAEDATEPRMTEEAKALVRQCVKVEIEKMVSDALMREDRYGHRFKTEVLRIVGEAIRRV